jgi:N-methylhydantoinase B
MTMTTIDPIEIEILRNAFGSITDETFASLTKSAFSTNIKERKDHSTAIVDAGGRLIAQTMASPIHIASMTGLMATMMARQAGPDGRFPGIAPGDIFIANDPHVAGGTHLPDVNMATPVFHDGRIRAFVCNIAHHADIGGMVPGSMAGGMQEIFQEGLRIPLIRLFRAGELQQDIFDLLLLNVRLPDERRGDYNAQIAACNLGARRLTDVIGAYGIGKIEAAFGEILSRTEARMRAAVAELPDGTYRFEDVMDDDGLGTRDIPIRLAATVSGDRIRFDFAGTSPQVTGNINVTMNATVAACVFGLQAMLDPDCPNNQGVIDVAEVSAPEGSLLNAGFPAPVAARAHTCQRIIDVVIGALAPAMPERAIGASNGANTTAVFSGTDPRTGQGYVYLETLGGGHGARATKDGKDGVQVNITNTSNLPVEAIEMEYPLMVEAYGLIPDSGGAGRWRGGMGLRRVVRPVGHECDFNGAGERFTNPPWGIFGGRPGGMGRFAIARAEGSEETLETKPSGVRIGPADRIIIETPGAGGYGPPAERTAEDIARDREAGKSSAAFQTAHYREDGK